MGAAAQSFADREMQSVADAMQDAAAAADDAAKEVGPRVLRGLSRFAYTSSYVLSYGVVYPVVFVAHLLPQENPVMHGLRDGARAAIDALKPE
jgi:hypothetical protein